MIATLLASGWHLEIERPAIFRIENGQPLATVDSVQGWRNPGLLPGWPPSGFDRQALEVKAEATGVAVVQRFVG